MTVFFFFPVILSILTFLFPSDARQILKNVSFRVEGGSYFVFFFWFFFWFFWFFGFFGVFWFFLVFLVFFGFVFGFVFFFFLFFVNMVTRTNSCYCWIDWVRKEHFGATACAIL